MAKEKKISWPCQGSKTSIKFSLTSASCLETVIDFQSPSWTPKFWLNMFFIHLKFFVFTFLSEKWGKVDGFCSSDKLPRCYLRTTHQDVRRARHCTIAPIEVYASTFWNLRLTPVSVRPMRRAPQATNLDIFKIGVKTLNKRTIKHAKKSPSALPAARCAEPCHYAAPPHPANCAPCVRALSSLAALCPSCRPRSASPRAALRRPCHPCRLLHPALPRPRSSVRAILRPVEVFPRLALCSTDFINMHFLSKSESYPSRWFSFTTYFSSIWMSSHLFYCWFITLNTCFYYCIFCHYFFKVRKVFGAFPYNKKINIFFKKWSSIGFDLGIRAKTMIPITNPNCIPISCPYQINQKSFELYKVDLHVW